MNNNKQQEFLETLKYSKLYAEMYTNLNEFKEFIVEQRDGAVNIDYDDIIKQFTVVTYVPYWKIDKFSQTNNLVLYRDAKALFLPFIKNVNVNEYQWAIDHIAYGEAIVKYHIWL